MKYSLNQLRKSFEVRKYFYFLSFMLMASTFLPLSYNNIRFITNYVGWAYLWFFSLLLFKPQIIKNKLVIYALLYNIFFLVLYRLILYGLILMIGIENK